jgi:hypothetical protein
MIHMESYIIDIRRAGMILKFTFKTLNDIKLFFFRILQMQKSRQEEGNVGTRIFTQNTSIDFFLKKYNWVSFENIMSL